VDRPDQKGQEPRSATHTIVSADYFRALGLPVLRGREFTSAEETSPTAAPVAIVDDVLVHRLFEGEDPIGGTIRVTPRPDAEPATGPNDAMRIVGVVPALRDALSDREPAPHIYVPSGRNHRAAVGVHVRVVRAGMEGPVLEAIRRELNAYDP